MSAICTNPLSVHYYAENGERNALTNVKCCYKPISAHFLLKAWDKRVCHS